MVARMMFGKVPAKPTMRLLARGCDDAPRFGTVGRGYSTPKSWNEAEQVFPVQMLKSARFFRRQ